MFHKDVWKRVIFTIPVCIVIFLAGAEMYCYHAGYMWLGEGSFISDISVYILFALLVSSYFATMMTDPGTTPVNYATTPGSGIHEASMCKFCDGPRPPRTHHCRMCDRCILRQDHHCPWVGNCVGIKNHRYFIQFLVYCTVNAGLVGACCAGFFFRSEEYNYFTVFGAVFGLILSTVVGGLAVFHIWGMLCNKTTIDVKARPLCKVFDTGAWDQNIQQVFGKRPLSFFLPISTYGPLDGTSYPFTLPSKEDIIDEDTENS